MKNIEYVLNACDKNKLHIYTANADVKDDALLAFTIIGDRQIDFIINLEELTYLIKYLNDCKDYLELKQKEL